LATISNLTRSPSCWDARRQGLAARRRSGNAPSPETICGSWLLSIDDCSPGDLDGQTRALLAMVTDDLDVWSDIIRRYSCDLFCGLFMSEGNEGADLAPEMLAMLGARGLRLGLDIYGPVRE
jgi:hypothetical protein